VMSADATLLAHQKKYDEVVVGEVSSCLNDCLNGLITQIEAEASGSASRKRARDECPAIGVCAC